MKKILIVFGTRPEAIKMAPVVNEFKKHSNIFETKVCVTGQHRQMLDQVLELFEIRPEYDLNLMQPGQDLFDITSRVLIGMREVLTLWEPNLVLVHGDTTTSTATAMAAFYKQILIGHVEAGLRTDDIYSPWPEEMNRQITGRLANIHFSPTERSKNNLIKENINPRKIFVTGNTVIDSLNSVVEKIQKYSDLRARVIETIIAAGYQIDVRLAVGNPKRKLVLVTGHRRENFGQGFLSICKGLKRFAESNAHVDIVYPVHLNPHVQKPVYEILGKTENIFLIPPVDYLPFVYLMSRCNFIISDSGGVQEEAPSLGKPVLVMRDTTERPEAVEAGTAKLVGSNEDRIVLEAQNLLNNLKEYEKMSQAHNPYGDGDACLRIVQCSRDLLMK